MRSISIIGASGFIGRRMYDYLGKHWEGRVQLSGTCFSHQVDPRFHSLDITDREALRFYLVENRFDLVVFLAGIKDIKRCESDPALAARLNVHPMGDLIEIISSSKLPTGVMYLSTDYVFDGRRGSYSDRDMPAPRTVYGATKLSAERMLAGSAVRHAIIRSAAVMGRGGVFYDWLVRQLRTPQDLRLFADVHFSPTPIRLLNEVFCSLIDDETETKGGIIHVVGERRLCRFDFGVILSGLITGACARLVAEYTKDGELFQKDLSMVQSDIVKRKQRVVFEEYLREEAADDQIN
jgi:dTDP-4-dehydrorhamnose reductase